MIILNFLSLYIVCFLWAHFLFIFYIRGFLQMFSDPCKDLNCWCPLCNTAYCSVTKLCLTLLWPHGLQHARLPCPSLFPGVCSNTCALSRSGYPTISSSVTSSFFCPQSAPASGSLPVSYCIQMQLLFWPQGACVVMPPSLWNKYDRHSWNSLCSPAQPCLPPAPGGITVLLRGFLVLNLLFTRHSNR